VSGEGLTARVGEWEFFIRSERGLKLKHEPAEGWAAFRQRPVDEVSSASTVLVFRIAPRRATVGRAADDLWEAVELARAARG
jgi:hypothetical protein